MIEEILRIQENYILHIDPLVLDHVQFRVIDWKILVLAFVIVIENSIPIELHHAQDTLIFF